MRLVRSSRPIIGAHATRFNHPDEAPLTPLVLAIGAAFVVVAVILGQPLLRRRRLSRLRDVPFPREWVAVLERRCAFYRRLPADLAGRLHGAISVFLADKQFYGCNGLAITDEMRLTIACHACVLTVEHGDDVYPWLRSVLVYPTAFLVDREYVDEAGIHNAEQQVLAGESWDEGRVIISWEDVLEDARSMDGVNVVVHEFAHQLDHQSGDVNGAPLLSDGHERWTTVMRDEYRRHCERVDADAVDDLVLDPYGATEPGEFFAVASEAFIETPEALLDRHAMLYALLKAYYRLDPAAWTTREAY